ncbi:GNAT family N-acetyltransferase [Rummeliibacillus pycnus]|uniref:GNAT family N-acetyltransferase n=1 Tax=Rummeliibacillus pycnus TaxID=101070 RepID=UPI000C9A71CA|nr:GNAT family protein [Rummeliibacillus pycnus]
MEFTTLHNEKVILKPMEDSDIKGIYEVAVYPEIWWYLSITIASIEDTKNYVTTSLANKEKGVEFPFVIINPATNAIIGSTKYMDIDVKHKRLEIGFTWLTPAYWRTPVNTNCKYLLLQYCFEVLNLNRVQIKTDHENKQSQKAIERIGAQKEGILRNHMIRKDGTVRNTVMYSVTSEDWPMVKSKLEDLMLLRSAKMIVD